MHLYEHARARTHTHTHMHLPRWNAGGALLNVAAPLYVNSHAFVEIQALSAGVRV